MTSLRLAAFQGHVEIVKLLIDSGANIEAADSVSNRSLFLHVLEMLLILAMSFHADMIL